MSLARATEGNETLITTATDEIILEGLFTTITNVNFNDKSIIALIQRVEAEKKRMIPLCYDCASSCGRNDDFNMHQLWNADEDIRSLKPLILFGIRGMAAYAYHGIMDILLGPPLPAFISSNILKYLVENYNISPISTPEEELKKLLS